MLITNIGPIINDILSQNKLIPEIGTNDFFSIKKNHLKRFYVAFCKTEDAKKVLLKVLINDSPKDRELILNEIKLYQFLSGQDFKAFRSPHIYGNGQTPAIWYKREFIEGGTIADMHFVLDEFVGKMEKYSQVANKALSEMASFVPPKKSEITPEASDYFVERIVEYDKYICKYLPDFKKLALDKYGAILTNTEDDEILTHGDYHLENLFFEESGLIVADWERVHVGNVSEDFSSLWASLWQVCETQKEILEYFYQKLSNYQKKSFDKNIDAMLLIQCAKEFQHWIYCKDVHRNPRYTIETVNDGFNFFKKVITELLDGSFKLAR